jgi:hypothetical protein
MKRLIQLNLLLLLISSATAQESQPQQPPKTLRVYDWNNLARQQTLPGEVISMDGISVLKIENTNDTPQDFLLLKISDPAAIKKASLSYGEMKYENVHDNAITSSSSELKLLSRIPPAAPGGDEHTEEQNAFLNGTSNWQPFRFIIVGRKAFNGVPTWPTQLEVHLLLAGNGTVYLRPIKLLGVVGSWWSPQQIGLIGGIGGSVIGCFGALLGILVSKGKAHNFVLVTMKISIALGILLTLAGLVAVMLKQPYAVWYALLLPGVILTLVFSLNLPSIQRRYDELEIRRMTSVDTMGS